MSTDQAGMTDPAAEPAEDGPYVSPGGVVADEPAEPAAADSAPAEPDAEPTDDPPADGDDVGQEDSDDRSRAGRDAARYRTRLREVEQERDNLSMALTEYQGRDAARIAQDAGLVDGEDLFEYGPVAQFLGDDGTVDPTKVRAATEQILADKPHRGRQRPPGHPSERLRVPAGGSDPFGDRDAPSWSSVLDRARGQ